MKIIPLNRQVIVKKLALPESKAFLPADPTVLGEVCRVIDKGPKCPDSFKVGDVIVVLGGQIYSVPALGLEWVHSGAVLMTIEGYENGGQK